jgi:hypothetical protein
LFELVVQIRRKAAGQSNIRFIGRCHVNPRECRQSQASLLTLT